MVTNSGRPLIDVDESFYECAPSRVMAALKTLKNEGRSWRQVAEHIGFKGSAAAVWKTAKGQMRSKEIERLLGMGPEKRSRFAGDLPDDLIEKLRAERDRLNLTNGELIELLWSAYQANR